jgi:hypothetical protein
MWFIVFVLEYKCNTILHNHQIYFKLFFHEEDVSQTLVADVLPEPPAHVKTLMAIANKVISPSGTKSICNTESANKHSGLPSQIIQSKKYPSIS